MEEMLPSKPSMVFVEFSVGTTVQGTIKIQLHKKLPNLRDNFVQIVMGKTGKGLRGIGLSANVSGGYIYGNCKFSDYHVEYDRNAISVSKQGSAVGNFVSGYLPDLFLYVGRSPSATYEWDSVFL